MNLYLSSSLDDVNSLLFTAFSADQFFRFPSSHSEAAEYMISLVTPASIKQRFYHVIMRHNMQNLSDIFRSSFIYLIDSACTRTFTEL